MKQPFSAVHIPPQDEDVEFVPFEHEIPFLSASEKQAWFEEDLPRYEPTEFEYQQALAYENSLIPIQFQL